MCGIAGFINNKQQYKKEEIETILNRMIQTISHRGPDADGVWSNPKYNIGLGHRRLSILDLSSEGKQPMSSVSGRYTIIFNGEIYNFKELKRELLRIREINFRGTSDTEVLLYMFEEYGIRNSIPKLVGMFAIAIFDNEDKDFYLIRDRIGEKPLYYGWQENSFIFASELKPFKEHPDFEGIIDINALGVYFKYNYIPSPYSIYKGIHKLQPGSMLKMNLVSFEYSLEKYWSPTYNKAENQKQYSETEIVNQLEKLIKTSVNRQMLSSDVPIGAFLSGGVDSSTIVALMQTLSEKPVNTFSIGFYEKGYNEATFAKEVAKYLGTNHTELYVTPKEAQDVVFQLPFIYDEPFADSSQIPTFLVSQLAKKNVTVSLSGDGGDELFGGYERYPIMDNLWNKIDHIPKPIKRFGASSIKFLQKMAVENLFPSATKKYLQRIYRGSDLLTLNDPREMYNRFLTNWNNTEKLVYNSEELSSFIGSNQSIEYFNNVSFYEWMMYVDLNVYLPDDILVKVDRASMAVSLETRVPLLDHNIIEFASKLPLNYKVRNGETKWILKQLMYRYLPKELMDRPKKGFSVPVGSWIKGPLKEWAEELLDENKLKEQGLLNSKLVRNKWNEHLNGLSADPQLWSILMFQAWLNKNR